MKGRDSHASKIMNRAEFADAWAKNWAPPGFVAYSSTTASFWLLGGDWGVVLKRFKVTP